MSDFSELQIWHASPDAEFSPVIYVEQGNFPNEISDLIEDYLPVDLPSTTIISQKRNNTDEIFQVAGPTGWHPSIRQSMLDLQLTLHEESGLFFLEDRQVFTIFNNGDDGKLEIVNWRVDHGENLFQNVTVSSFLDSITWCFTSANSPTKKFTTQYIWRGYKP